MSTLLEALRLGAAMYAAGSTSREKIDAAIAELESQKIVAWMNSDECVSDFAFRWVQIGKYQTPVYKSPPKDKPPTDEMIVSAARVLNSRAAKACNVDEADSWNLYADEYIEDARAALEAANGIKGQE